MMKSINTCVLHIPHSSRFVPADVLPQFRLSGEQMEAEIVRMTDSFTDELFNFRGAVRIIFPVCRLVVDPERFLDDSLEPMSSVGLGTVYTRSSQGTALRYPLSPEEKQDLIEKYYLPHHAALTAAVKTALASRVRCLIIDCHSFPSVPLPCEPDKSPDRPDICLGTDAFHTPGRLVSEAENLFKTAGFSLKLNSPYEGTIVPLDYYRTNKSVSSLMIEVNRRLYMDEKTGHKIPAFTTVQTKTQAILTGLHQSFSL
jgi:N-formylglutamate deformylase